MIKELKIDGMSCMHCVAAVEKELKKLNPKKVSVEIGSAFIEYDELTITDEEINKAIVDAGFALIEHDNL